IGSGKVGRTLGRALKNAGYQIGVVAAREQQNANEAVEFIGAGIASTDSIVAAESGTVHLITANDSSISAIAEDIAARGPATLQNHYFFHVSGALASTVLEPLRSKGAEIGSMHPLQVFADPAKAMESLPGTYYAIEGSDRAMSLAVQIVDKLQGKLL